MSSALDRTRSLIAEHGWAVIRVPEDIIGPGFAYSIGLVENYGHPEIAVSGLPGPLMHRLVNHAAALVAEGMAFQHGRQSDALLEGCACEIRALAPESYDEYLGRAVWHYDDRPFEAVQIFWPDREGRYPWDPGYDTAEQERMDQG